MKKLILMLIMVSISFASGTHKIKGEIDTSYIIVDRKHKIKDFYNEMWFSNAKLRYEYKNEGFTFKTMPFVTHYTSEQGPIFNGNIMNEFDQDEFFFKELYASYTTGNHTFGAGLLPFSDNSFIEFQDDYIKKGEGLSTIIEMDFMNLFYMYKLNDEVDFKAGIGKINALDFIPRAKYTTEAAEDSNFAWAVLDQNYEKWKFYSQFIYADGKYNKKKAFDAYLFGQGVAYDDTEYSGLSVYGIGALSVFDGKQSNIYKDQMEDFGMPAGMENMFPDNFDTQDEILIGGSVLAGIRKDFDLNWMWFVNFEHFHVFGDWFSGNSGIPYRGNCSTMLNVRDYSNMIAIGTEPRKHLQLKVFFVESKLGNMVIGSPARRVSMENSLGNGASVQNYLRFQVKYTF